MTRRRRALEELDQEIRDHIEHEIQDNLSRGMTPEEARRAALLAFGNVTLLKEDARAVWIPVWLDQIVQDARYSLGLLRRNPGFTAVAVMMLALGIGVNTAVFTVANAVFFKGFPFVVRNDRVLYINSPKNENGSTTISYPDFEDWRAQAKSFEGMATVRNLGMILKDNGDFPERYDATQVSANTFKLIGQRPIIGRDFVPSDEMPGASPVAILSYGLWESRYGKDPAVIGRTVRMNGIPTTVIGVMRQGFSFPQRQVLWVPLVPTPDLQKREARNLWFAFGRMADGVTIESARAEMDTIGQRLASAYPLTNRAFIPRVQNFHEFFLGRNATMIYGSMWGAVGFVLLLACANLANLLLVRAIGRSREISVRMALGAGRWRIMRQLFIESVMLSAIGGAFGWWIAKLCVRIYEVAAYHGRNPAWVDFTMDYRVLGYLIAISIGTGLLFGLAPALRLSQLDINALLKDGGRGATDGGRGRHLSALFVTGEMALAVVLLAGAGVMIRSFLHIYTASVGVNPANVLMTFVVLADHKYSRAEAQISFFDRLETRLEAIPGVESIAIASSDPTGGSLSLPYELAGDSPVDEQRRPTLSALVISPAYFRTVGAAILSGRQFDDADGVSGVPVVIVNRRFAGKYWPGESPLGKRLRLFDGSTPGAWVTVVGVASNILQNDGTRQEIDPLVYLPYRQKPKGVMVVIARTRVVPESLGTAFWREIQAIDSNLPIYEFFTLDERLKWNYRDNGNFAVLFLIFAAIALLLASVGLYAVISHSLSRRTQEIGIRMALGATARDILNLVFRQGMLPVGIGLTIGLAASFGVNRILKSELVHVSPNDPVTLVVASATLILAATLGCWIPARRAMRVDPAVALRHE